MHDALGMSGVQRVHHLDGEIQQFLDSERFGSDAVLESAAFQALHNEEGLPPDSPTSCKVQMLGWLSADTARASR